MTTTMHELPLLFTFKDRVEGRGFLADVEAQGRVLSVHDFGEVWMNGVQPGGIAASGKTKSKAYRAFKNTYTTVLFDIASEAATFAMFKSEVEEFFHQVCDPREKEWWDAVKRVKKENYTEEGLRKRSAGRTRMKITVKNVEEFTPEHNTVETEEHLWHEQALLAA